MDNFAEQLVKRQPTGADRMKTCIILILGMLLTFLALIAGFVFSFLLLFVAVALGVGTFFLYRNSKVEYEYTFTNGELDIDKIINQTKRKEMLTISVSKFTAFGKYANNIPDETEDMTTVFATDNIVENEYSFSPHALIRPLAQSSFIEDSISFAVFFLKKFLISLNDTLNLLGSLLRV